MQTVAETLEKLKKSAFRSRFRLTDKDRMYIANVGMERIRSHAAAFIAERLAPANPPKDGRQTPWKGHPVFIAQHATACCCRGCLQKWYRISPDRPLSADEQQRIVNLLMAWIEREMEKEG